MIEVAPRSRGVGDELGGRGQLRRREVHERLSTRRCARHFDRGRGGNRRARLQPGSAAGRGGAGRPDGAGIASDARVARSGCREPRRGLAGRGGAWLGAAWRGEAGFIRRVLSDEERAGRSRSARGWTGVRPLNLGERQLAPCGRHQMAKLHHHGPDEFVTGSGQTPGLAPATSRAMSLALYWVLGPERELGPSPWRNGRAGPGRRAGACAPGRGPRRVVCAFLGEAERRGPAGRAAVGAAAGSGRWFGASVTVSAAGRVRPAGGTAGGRWLGAPDGGVPGCGGRSRACWSRASSRSRTVFRRNRCRCSSNRVICGDVIPHPQGRYATS